MYGCLLRRLGSGSSSNIPAICNKLPGHHADTYYNIRHVTKHSDYFTETCVNTHVSP